MRRIIFSGVHAVGKTTYAKKLLAICKSQGYNTRIYSLDNFRIYRTEKTASSQFDRLYYGNQKLKEAEEESPEIAIFDRALSDNILYSKCFNRFMDGNQKKYISDEELLNITQYYQSLETRKTKFESTIIFLNPPLESLIKNIKERGREKDNILETEDFVTCLKKVFESYYHQYFESPCIELTNYTETDIINLLKTHDIIQADYE